MPIATGVALSHLFATTETTAGFYIGGPETSNRRVFGRSHERTILYVEDDITDVILLNAALEDASGGVRLVAFRDPGEANLVCARAAKAPNLVVLDINMPGMGGLELLRRLRLLPAFEHTPIVILTTSSNPLFREQAIERGADSYIVKPPTFEGYPGIARHILSLAGARQDS
jgi:CheY-like chemotaxis protein